MGAYLFFKTTDDAEKINDFLEKNENNKKLGDEGIWLVDKKHIDWVKKERPDMLEWELKKLNTGDVKVSSIDGRSKLNEEEVLELQTKVFEALNENFEMKYYAGSCAFTTEEYYYSIEQMKRITRNGEILSGKSSKSERGREKYNLLYPLLSEPEKKVFDLSIVKEKDELKVNGSWYEVKDTFKGLCIEKNYILIKLDKIEEIQGYRKYVPKIRYGGASADVESYVLDNMGNLVYLEIIGQEDMVKSIASVLMQGRLKMNNHTIDATFGLFSINKAGNKRKVISLENGLAHAIVYHFPSIAGNDFNILLGDDEEGLINSFTSWLEKSQPLPYPKELTQKLYEKLQSNNKLTELRKLNIEAVEVELSLLQDESKDLQEYILEVCKENGLIDPNAKPLKEQFPLPKSPVLQENQVQKIWDTLNSMPKTYELEDMKIKPIGLKLFSPNMTLYITEADRGREDDEFENMHTQCFGYIKNESDPQMSEWGYIDVPEYIKAGNRTYYFEQDLYFENMYIDSKGNVGELKEFTKYRENFVCPKCSSKQVEIHESIDGYHHCSCIDCGHMFNKKIKEVAA